MGFLKSAVSSIASTALGAAGGAFSAKQQYKYQKKAMQKRHQWEVTDLRKAGLNPILSAGGQPPIGNITAPHSSVDVAGDQVKNQTRKLISSQARTAKSEANIKSMEERIKAWEYNLLGTQAGQSAILPLRILSSAGLNIKNPAIAASALAFFKALNEGREPSKKKRKADTFNKLVYPR